MHLIGLVIAGQGIHHQINAKAIGHFTATVVFASERAARRAVIAVDAGAAGAGVAAEHHREVAWPSDEDDCDVAKTTIYVANVPTSIPNEAVAQVMGTYGGVARVWRNVEPAAVGQVVVLHNVTFNRTDHRNGLHVAGGGDATVVRVVGGGTGTGTGGGGGSGGATGATTMEREALAAARQWIGTLDAEDVAATVRRLEHLTAA